MAARNSWLPLAAVIGGWTLIAGFTAASLVLDYHLVQAGRDDLAQVYEYDVTLAFATAIISAATVGSTLILLRPEHPVGWLLFLLAVTVDSSALLDSYARYGAVALPGSLPGAGLVATLGDLTFSVWLALLALVFLLTPSGRLASAVARGAAVCAVGGSLVHFGTGLFRPYRGTFADLGIIENPLEVSSLAGPLGLAGTAGLAVLHIALLAGVGMLLLRFRAAADADRRKLRWLALAAIPFPMLVIGAWFAAAYNNEAVLALVGGGFLAVVPIGIGLAIEQDHLFDVDRLISRGLTYSLLTAGLVGCYAAVVFVAGRVLGGVGGGSEASAVVATLLSISLVLPARSRVQRALDRRFNRRQFDAVETVRRFVLEPAAGTTIENVLRQALGDETLTVAYWIDEREHWVDEDGGAATVGPGAVAVERRGARIAAVGRDLHRGDRRLADAVIAAALPEIENARLRAAIALQLVEVRESRARIVAAQAAERRKIERNLHDGAQQRLLAVALQLRAAEIGEDSARLRSAMDSAISELQSAVGELRELANGLHPASLADGGLAAALDDLAARTPVDVRLNVTAERFPSAVEQAAWYIICEAVTNAVKHGEPRRIDIAASGTKERLDVSVEDDGCGGADPLGNGLRGIADRAEAAGGRLVVRERAAGGTIVAAELPCGS